MFSPEFNHSNKDDREAELGELCIGELHVEYLQPAIRFLFGIFIKPKLKTTLWKGIDLSAALE